MLIIVIHTLLVIIFLMVNKELKYCRICNSQNLIKYIDLGQHPFSNSFLLKRQIKYEKKFPLELVLCKNCSLSQLSIIPDTKFIFNKYDYLSSSSKALSNHYKNLVKSIVKKQKAKLTDTVLDIGCNDGILLDHYPSNYKNIIGIEPSNTINFLDKKRITGIKTFFNYDYSKKFLKKYDKPLIITITNVLAQIEDLNDFTKGLENILHDQGIIVIEFPYLLEMVKNGFFDLIYHEHLSYFALTSLRLLFSKYNLKIFDFEKIEIGASGPALRLYISKKKSKFRLSKRIIKQFKIEESWGIKKINTYKKFNKKAELIINKVKKTIILKFNKGYRLGCYTASAKGNTMLNCLNLNKKYLQFVSENNIKKINKYTPGTHIKIVNDKEFLKKKIDYALLLSWNYAKFFIKNTEYKKRGGKFIIPFPQFKIK